MGNSSFKYNLFKKLIKIVLSQKNAYVALGGDIVDAITVTDPRFNIDATLAKQLRVSAQRDAAVEMLRPLESRILYALDGNHEHKLNNVMLITEEIMEKLGIYYDFGKKDGGEKPAYGTYTAVSDLGALRLFDWHGWGNCNSRAGDSHQREMNEQIFVKRKLRDLHAGCPAMVMHHGHRVRIHPPSTPLLITSDIKGKLKASYTEPARIPFKKDPKDYYVPEEHRWYAMSGSFLGGLAEGHSPYSERFGLPPTDMGCVKVVVKNDKFLGLEKVIISD